MERAPLRGALFIACNVALGIQFDCCGHLCVPPANPACFGGMRLYVLAGYVCPFCVLMGSIRHFHSYRLVFDHEGKVARFGNAFQIFVDEAQVVS